MEQKNKSRARDLQIFLIRKFLVVIFVIYFCQQLINLFYQKVFLHIVVDIMGAGEISGGGETLVSGFRLLVRIVGKMLADALPPIGTKIVERILRLGDTSGLQAPAFLEPYGSLMTRLYYITLIMMIVILLLVSIMPYVIAGWWYIHCIYIKMNELRQSDIDQKTEYDRRRNLLFSDIVHDVKTPITTVTGYSRALMDGLIKDPDKQQEYLQAIHAKSMRISDLITMLFEFVKLDSEGFTLHKQKYDLAELCRENVIMHFSDFEDKGLELDVDIPDDVCMAMVDRIQMSRVVTNLLTNTIRYLKEGDRVFVSLVKISDEASRDYEMYKISVADSGIPIEESLVDNIFDPFTRADSARNTVSGGSGLGLSIAHKVAEMHGGRLELVQPCGEGYTKSFDIYVPPLKDDMTGADHLNNNK